MDSVSSTGLFCTLSFLSLSLDRLRSIAYRLQQTLSHVQIEVFLDIKFDIFAVLTELVVKNLDVKVLDYRLPSPLFCIEVAGAELCIGFAFFLFACHAEFIVEL